MMFCCDGLKRLIENAGQQGMSVLVYQTSLGFRFDVQSRAFSREDETAHDAGCVKWRRSSDYERGFGDPLYQAPGWEKWQVVSRLSDGSNIVVHYMKNDITGATAQFKFK
jgi:hypothetical protein